MHQPLLKLTIAISPGIVRVNPRKEIQARLLKTAPEELLLMEMDRAVNKAHLLANPTEREVLEDKGAPLPPSLTGMAVLEDKGAPLPTNLMETADRAAKAEKADKKQSASLVPGPWAVRTLRPLMGMTTPMMRLCM